MEYKNLFDKTRLTEARELHGLTKTALAEDVNVSPAAISQYESGDARPQDATIKLLSLRLSMPIDFFLFGRHNTVQKDGFFRSLRATPKGERRKAQVLAKLTAEVASELENYVRFPEYSVPLYPAELKSNKEQIEEIASLVRQEFGLGIDPIPNVVRLLESKGVVISRSQLFSRNVSAFSCKFSPHPIVVLTNDDAARSRMDAAHELGHLVMHDSDPGDQVLETQANIFASAFLCPWEAMEKELPQRVSFRSLYELKKKWGISIKALLYRAHSLDRISDSAYKRAMIKYNKDFSSGEPIDLGEPEKPMLLRKALEVAIESGLLMKKFAKDTALSEDMVNDIICSESDNRPEVKIAT